MKSQHLPAELGMMAAIVFIGSGDITVSDGLRAFRYRVRRRRHRRRILPRHRAWPWPSWNKSLSTTIQPLPRLMPRSMLPLLANCKAGSIRTLRLATRERRSEAVQGEASRASLSVRTVVLGGKLGLNRNIFEQQKKQAETEAAGAAPSRHQ